VTGVVQGVGFRPFVYRLARELGLAGWVRNTSSGVEIEVEGPPDSLERFTARLQAKAPALARIDAVQIEDSPPEGQKGFLILESRPQAATEATIPADVATCDDCFAEITDPKDRRYRYAFTNCTNCGPRFTLIKSVPYDRANTTMATFTMCPQCGLEYHDPEDRRFHAEPTACPACGPHLWLMAEGQRREADALEAAGELLRRGKIVAVKGLGGFHLACDARQDAAVRSLRARKGRVAKPFALMVRDLAEAKTLGDLTDDARALLLSSERPVVLARRRFPSPVSEAVAPGNNYLGLLLPYTPLHQLLFEFSPPALVMTSGNLSEEPLAFTNQEAAAKLGALADAFLLHDREIHVPCDDSVVRPMGPGEATIIRRARGYVPRTISLPLEAPEPILGAGAEQKNTFCLAWNRTALLSQHIGDLDTVETFDYYQLAIRHFQALSRKAPTVLAHDLHPDYLSTRYAKDREGVRRIGVQHHHAHIAACLAENGRTEPALGLALDGTGFGPDGTVWGGEILVADLAGFTRAGYLQPVPLPGGEAAVRDPRKMALAYLYAAFGNDFAEIARRLDLDFTPLEWAVAQRQLTTGLNSPLTSSAGRLFDAVAAALGVCRTRTYEGQPAVELEMLAEGADDGEFYPASVNRVGDSLVMDAPAIFRGAVAEHLAGVDPAAVAARFHQSLIRLLARACELVREQTGLESVALSGGVFQNGLMLNGLKQRLTKLGFATLTHRQTPPNDGSISLGQVAVAAARLRQEKER
jgi:hydrogenase maturation protein HypF